MMTSKDYYFDSYSHFGKTVCLLLCEERAVRLVALIAASMCVKWKKSETTSLV